MDSSAFQYQSTMLALFRRVNAFHHEHNICSLRTCGHRHSTAYHMQTRNYALLVPQQSTCTDDIITNNFDPLLTHIPSSQYDPSDLPKVFAYPHYYEPHPIAKYAADKLREQMYASNEFNNDMVNDTNIVGKMMGVLVVQYNNDDTNEQQLGYLQAHSGRFSNEMTNPNDDFGFCPSVYNPYEQDDGFYKAGEDELNTLNKAIDQLENDPNLLERRQHLMEIKEEMSNAKWSIAKKNAKEIQNERCRIRQERRTQLISDEEYQVLDRKLKQEGTAIQREMKRFKSCIKQQIQVAEADVHELEQQLQDLKDVHKQKSMELQNKLFNRCKFLNIHGETKSLLPLFANTTIQRPPIGAGDCAAPKLLQYAFTKGYIPIAMAEFWWGTSPSNEIRRHDLYYPACRGKCQPILQHMLEGMNVEENPLEMKAESTTTKSSDEELEILYEDEYMVVINKPDGIMSTPGKYLDHSVYTIMKKLYPNATGPLLVHRLDMATSGILLVAKDECTHKALAKQFIDRSIQKRYVGELISHADTVFINYCWSRIV